MVFNSYIFIFVLLPIALISYFGLNRIKKYTLAKVAVIASSLCFYAYFHLSYLALIIGSILFNYGSYRLTIKSKSSKALKTIMALTITANLIVLFIFKYYDFFISNINNFGFNAPLLNILLPLGISFFTFQQIGFNIDAYKGKACYLDGKSYHFIDYTLFVSFFPQLVAGPIVNHKELIPQFQDQSKKEFNYENFSKGFYSFVIGLSKKVLIADVFSLAADYGFSIFNELNTPSAIFVAFVYVIQLYFDFSGYSDMARGLGFMMNIELPLNFNSPYKTTNLADFWNHWHITLSKFFTSYVYIPLGGNRKGVIRTYINIFIIFTLSGLWHGAEWTYVIWGILNGIGVIIARFIKEIFKNKKINNYIYKIIKPFLIFINFTYFTFTIIIFRSENLNTAIRFIKNIFNMNFQYGIFPNIIKNFQTDEMLLALRLLFLDDFSFSYMLAGLIYFIIAIFIIFFTRNVNEQISDFKPSIKKALYISLLFIWCISSFSGISTFIYYNF